MNQHSPSNLPAPCIVDSGIIVNKVDMLRLLKGLSHVRYIYRQDDQVTSTGEGRIMEAFADANQATLVANHSLYLNVYSFDYLEMVSSGHTETANTKSIESETARARTTFALVQENRCLCITPIVKDTDRYASREIDAAALEAIVTEALSASWDASLDDERNL